MLHSAHIPIVDILNRASVGFITSGCPSPYLEKNIAMGYVDVEDSTPGRVLNVEFGDKVSQVTVTKLPFIRTNYYLPPKIQK